MDEKESVATTPTTPARTSSPAPAFSKSSMNSAAVSQEPVDTNKLRSGFIKHQCVSFLLRCCSVCPLSLSSSRSLFLWLSFGFFFFFFFPLKCLVLMCCNFFFFLHHFVNWLLSIFFLLLCCSFPLSFSSTLNMNASKRFNLHYLSSTVLLCVVGNTALLWDINPDTKKKITIMGHGGAGIGAVTVYREQ